MTKIAIIQQPPVYLDLEKSMARAVDLVAEAAGQGARLVVFPEAWFPGYPTFVWRLPPGAGMGKTDALFAQLQANAIDLGRDGMTPLQEAAKEHEMVVVAGYQELDGALSGSTLFNSCVIIDADGTIANNHRKLMPTNPERMVWGFGDGSGLNVVETAVGRIGALLCWENYMPLARYALYAQQIEIYVAPTWDSGATWLATMQHIAREGGCWVVGCATALEVSDIPEDLPFRDDLFPEDPVQPNGKVAKTLRHRTLRFRRHGAGEPGAFLALIDGHPPARPRGAEPVRCPLRVSRTGGRGAGGAAHGRCSGPAGLSGAAQGVGDLSHAQEPSLRSPGRPRAPATPPVFSSRGVCASGGSTGGSPSKGAAAISLALASTMAGGTGRTCRAKAASSTRSASRESIRGQPLE